MKKFPLLAVILTLITMVAYFPVMERFTQSFKFVDEDEHIVVASLMNGGKKLYRDISTNHQPLNYILSAGLQSVTHPANTFMQLKRHREAVFLWSLLWGVLLAIRFGVVAWPVVLAIEGMRYLVLGQAFVAESLAAYPMAYWYGAVIEQWFSKKVWREDFFLGLVAAGLVFLLLPLAAPLLFLVIARYVLLKGKGVGWFVAGIVSVAVIVFAVVTPTDYFRETIYHNVAYTIPSFSRIDAPMGRARLFILPILAFSEKHELMSYWIMGIFALWLIPLVLWIYTRQWRKVFWWLALYLVWGASNSRVYQPNRYFYEAFHILPWMAAGLLGGIVLTKSVWAELALFVRRILGGLLALGLLVLLTFRGMPIYGDIDPKTEHYVQFNGIAQMSEIIAVIQQPGDRLMSMPNEVMTYWTTGLIPATRMVTYYEWQYSPLQNRQEFLAVMAQNPPEFVQYFNDRSRFIPTMEEVLKNRYRRIFSVNRTDGVMSLFVLDSRYQTITTSQWDTLKALPLNLEYDTSI